jgi:hypothetical protein
MYVEMGIYQSQDAAADFEAQGKDLGEGFG